MTQSPVVAVGHACTESGSSAVALFLDQEWAALTPCAARKIAAQLLAWADHAEAWQGMSHEERQQRWLAFMGERVRADGAVETEKADG